MRFIRATKPSVFLGIILAVVAGYASSVYSQQVSKNEVTHHTVEISGFEFVPKALSLSTGDIVTWVNKDVVPHNVVNSANQKTLSPDLATGEKYTYVVQAPMKYECGFHPSMKAELVISDSQ